jgi:dTDP-4-dehydrorhamnose reductase
VIPDAVYPSRAALDLTADPASWHVLDELNPDMVINCAAYTAVDRAEDEEDVALAVNSHGVEKLARYCEGRNARLVTFSTDYVFDGEARRPYVESDLPNPMNAYGRSKRLGEHHALAFDDALVIRTSWVVSGTHPNFVATMLRLAKRRCVINVVADQMGCPTVADDLASATVAALRAGASGLLHLTNTGATTWFELARRAVEIAGLDAGVVHRCATSEYPLRAPRPSYSVLGSERLSALGVGRLPPWEDSLRGVVSQLLD